MRFGFTMKRLQVKGLDGVATQLCLELAELLKWLVPDSTAAQRHEMLLRAFEASDQATRKELIAMFPQFFTAQRDRRGRPVGTKRQLWVRAYEERLRGQQIGQLLSWRRIAIKHCECGETQHTEKCSKRIRQGVRCLQHLLRKYQVDLPI
jgi:hypothetical protein